MAQKHPTVAQNQGRRISADRPMEQVEKSARFELELPDFVLNSGVSRITKFMDYLRIRSGTATLCSNKDVIAAKFNENGISGKIKFSQIGSQYCVDYEVGVLRTDQVACSIFNIKAMAFLYSGRPPAYDLLASEDAFGPGNRDHSLRGRQMKIPCGKIPVLETNSKLLVDLKVQAVIFKQPEPHSTFGTCGVVEQCDPPFLKPLQKGEGSDVQLVCEDKTFPVHGFILKNVSHVFRTMLEVPMIEAATGKIVIKDLTVDTVQRMVDYMYHGRINFGSDAQVVDLLYGAEKYELNLLKTACLERMVTFMSDENVMSFLEISVRVNAGNDFIKQMVDYCMNRIKELRKREEFLAFARANPNLFLENWLSN